MKKFVSACLILAGFWTIGCFAQEAITGSSGSPPKWRTQPPPGYLNDYFVGEGESRTSATEASKEALGSAILKILQTRAFEANASFAQTRSQDGEVIKKTIVEELRVNGISTTVKGLTQEETYFETWRDRQGAIYRFWVLVRIPKTKEIISPPTKFGPVWRSTIAPGWGQFYKGQPTKGFIIALSEALSIPAGFVFENLKVTATADAKNARTQALRDYYTDQANLYQNLSLASWIAAAAIYVFNILDAIVSDGEKLYVDRLGVDIKPTVAFGQPRYGFTFSIPF